MISEVSLSQLDVDAFSGDDSSNDLGDFGKELDVMPQNDIEKLREAVNFILEMKQDWPRFKGMVLKHDGQLNSGTPYRGNSPQGYFDLARLESPTGRYEIQELLKAHDLAKEAAFWGSLKKHGAKVIATLVGMGIAFGIRALWDSIPHK